MCNFFSCISDGNGKVLFFKPEDIVKIMSEGNPKSYEFNSHTSIAHYNNISPTDEDTWNKWEYNPTRKELGAYSRPTGTRDDSEAVKNALLAFFDGKDIAFMQNLYNWNSGDRNSGDWNSGDRNSGNRNSGDWNSGNWNSGNWNSGDCNSGLLVGGFNSKKIYFLFNKPCKETDYQKFVDVIANVHFVLTEWVYSSQMTEDEKKQYSNHAVCGGFLRKYEYKEAWKKALAKVSSKTVKAIKKIKNYDAKVFFEITGVKI